MNGPYAEKAKAQAQDWILWWSTKIFDQDILHVLMNDYECVDRVIYHNVWLKVQVIMKTNNVTLKPLALIDNKQITILEEWPDMYPEDIVCKVYEYNPDKWKVSPETLDLF